MTTKELQLGTTHRGRYLCGWVAVDDAFFGIASVSLLLKDVTGYLVEIAVYGLVDLNVLQHEKQHYVASRFPKGQPIVIIEPYYKGLNVLEKPWKRFFNVLNAVNEGRGAIACYQNAIEDTQPAVRALALLFNNLAACRSKAGDFKPAIQLAGVAVHLEPANIKGWFMLSSALVKVETREQAKYCSQSIAERVIAYACTVIPNLSPKQRQLLESTLKRSNKAGKPVDDSYFNSYMEWCVRLASPGFVILSEKESEVEMKNSEEWRKAGSEYFAKDEFLLAEECYRKGVSVNACCQDMSSVLNNIAATHLKLHQETRDVPNISVGGISTSGTCSSNIEIALLNCTIAGILDPLNHKAWIRRGKCLQYLGVSRKEYVADLQAVYDDISALSNENCRVLEFKSHISDAIKQCLKHSTASKHIQPISEVPTEKQRAECDAVKLENPSRREESSERGLSEDTFNGGEESIDQYIAQMEAFENSTRFAFAASKRNHQEQNISRELVMFIKHPPPQVHAEFPKLRGWPEGLDPIFARKVLYRAYLDVKYGHMVKRWNGIGAMEILRANAEVLRFGDAVDGREAFGDAVPQYEARIRSNFGNNPNRAEICFFATTHVAIGFNDFSSLIAATLRTDINRKGPLKFVGFEMSEFAVAKCKVVAQMQTTTDIAISSVMEVWLSSTWSEETLKSFRKSVKLVLRSLHGHNVNAKVLSYLKNWVTAETISAAKARSEFFLNLERCNAQALVAVCCFKREIDRLDLTQYMLTGEIRSSPNCAENDEKFNVDAVNMKSASGLATTKSKKRRNRRKELFKNQRAAVEQQNGTTSVGSLTMWNVPFGAPPLEEDIAFNTVDFMTILNDYSNRLQKQNRAVEKLSIVDLFVLHILKNLQRLRVLILGNKLTIEVNHGVVKAVRGETASDSENNELLKRIAMMRPYTISWSNVLDYFLPDDFHDVARRCSMYGDCMHYGYSMNWPTQVFGASLPDYDHVDHKQAINSVLDLALGFVNKSASSPLSFPDLSRKYMGLDKLVSLPFRGNPLNGTGYILAAMFKQKWIDHFMDKGQMTSFSSKRLGLFCTPVNCGLQSGAMELGIPSPLYHSSLTLYMSWCYDPEMRLHAKSPSEMDAKIGMLQQT